MDFLVLRSQSLKLWFSCPWQTTATAIHWLENRSKLLFSTSSPGFNLQLLIRHLIFSMKFFGFNFFTCRFWSLFWRTAFKYFTVDRSAFLHLPLANFSSRLKEKGCKLTSVFHLLHKQGTYFHVRLIDGAAKIFIPTSYASAGNQSHLTSVAPLWRTLIQDALPTELPRPQLHVLLQPNFA